MPREARGHANGVQRAPGSILNVYKSTIATTARRTKFSDFVNSTDDAWDMDESSVAVKGTLNASSPSAQTPSKGKSVAYKAADAVESRSGSARVDKAASVTISPTAVLTAAQQKSDKEQALWQKFANLLEAPRLNIEKLRNLSWHGIPKRYRPWVWRLLIGYVPPVAPDKRDEYLHKKRREYHGLVTQYYGSRLDEKNKTLFHQIVIDVPRTNPRLGQFQDKQCQEVFERVLYIWALRHPGSSYVQGMNDLVTPFFNTFIEDSISCSVSDLDFSSVDAEMLSNSEADSFWCLSKLLDSIQDNYTMAQKGIQRKVMALADLVSRIDKPLYDHLQEQNVPFLHFSFRWMNCLLMRELPLKCAVRMFDTYLAEIDGFATFHLYVCAAFLLHWSKSICATRDFTELLTLLQNLPTDYWTDNEIGLVLSEAFVWKHKFHGSKVVS